MKSQQWGVVLLGVALLAVQARATIIAVNFDNLASNITVTNQYPDVVFSSVSNGTLSGTNGDVILTFAGNPPYRGSVPNDICTADGTSLALDCIQGLVLTFSIPFGDVSFDAYLNQTPTGQAFATADVFQNGSLIPTHPGIPLLVTHTHADNTAANCAVVDCIADHQELTFPNITKIIIRPTASELGNNQGSVYDNFVFDTADAPGVPEPSTLLLTGFCGIVWVGRRFLARKRA